MYTHNHLEFYNIQQQTLGMSAMTAHWEVMNDLMKVEFSRESP